MSPATGHVHQVHEEILAGVVGLCECGAEWSRSGRGKRRKRHWRDPNTAYGAEVRRRWIERLALEGVK